MHLIDYTIISVYLLAIVVIGVLLQRKASGDIDSYFLGNRDLPWWALGASGMASNTDIAGTMINTAMVYVLGTMGFFVEIRGGMVLILAFLMIFMGKWNRRAEVMTMAEWMHLRFGKTRQGDIARIISAVSNLVITIAMISYFAVGAGKFAGEILGINWRIASLAMAGLATIYTVASGLYGVVWTDVFQGFLIFITIIFVCGIAATTADIGDSFYVSVPLADGTFQQIQRSFEGWSSLWPPMEMDLPGTYSIYNLFGLTILFYLFKVTLEGSGSVTGYMIQRYFAAKSDREAGLLTLFWTLLLMFRWPLTAAFALLGIYYGVTNEVIADPELVLPTVINTYIPVGLKGMLIAGLIAAAMSTFDSTVNAGAAYWVKDIYQAYINPAADEKKLVLHSRVASLALVALGLAFSFTIRNINDIWGWITMGIGAGMFIPLVMRWYWWRFNGYGFAIGTAAGMISAVITRLVSVGLPEYWFFIISSGSALLGCVIGTLLTRPPDDEVLLKFYKKTRSFGFWKHIREKLPASKQNEVNTENRRDIISTIMAVPWQFSLFFMAMMMMLGRWDNVAILATIFVTLSVGLYFTWFRHLKTEVEMD